MKNILTILFFIVFITFGKAQYSGGIQDGYAKAFPVNIPDQCMSVLPTELINFSGEYLINNRQVKLDWVTDSEINNDYFIVQKSLDAITWDVIEFINGAGNSNFQINYSTFDKKPFFGLNYYRLKQVDFEGKSNYSNIITVQTKEEMEEITIYPNPGSDLIYVLGVKDDFKYKIYNSKGILIKEGISGLGKPISIIDLNQGLYSILIEDPFKIVSTKLNKIH